jgi:hypothetical protein
MNCAPQVIVLLGRSTDLVASALTVAAETVGEKLRQMLADKLSRVPKNADPGSSKNVDRAGEADLTPTIDKI